MKYQIMYNNAAGEHYVNKYTEEEWDNWEESGVRNQEGHYSEIEVCNSQEEVDKFLEEFRGETVFAVFEDRPAGEVFMSEEDCLSGNWRGSKYGYSNLVAEYNNREEAEAHVQRSKEYFAAL